MAEFGDRLRRLREARGWSRRRLETEADIPHGIISRLESARPDARAFPSMRVAMRLARIFGVTLDYLCGMDEGEESDNAVAEVAMVGT